MTATAAATVLIVDDDKNVCEALREMLAGQGYSSAVAGNGREALDYLRAAALKPSLILLDLMMPEMTGWQFRQEQQGDPSLASIPVAIITGLPESEGKASEVGVVDVLYKPSRVEDLAAVLSRFCK